MGGVVGHVLRQHDVRAPVRGHDPHFQRRDRLGDASAIKRQPMALGENEENRPVAASPPPAPPPRFRLPSLAFQTPPPPHPSLPGPAAQNKNPPPPSTPP